MELYCIKHLSKDKYLGFMRNWSNDHVLCFKTYSAAVSYLINEIDHLIYETHNILDEAYIVSTEHDDDQQKVIDVLRANEPYASRTQKHINKFDTMANAEFLFYIRNKTVNTKNGLPKIQKIIIEAIYKERKLSNG